MLRRRTPEDELLYYERRVHELICEKHVIKSLAAEQAADPGLWFEAQTAPEAYLQAALRRLHRVIEAEK